MSNKFNLQDEIDRMKAYEAKTTMSNTPLPEPAYYQWRRKKLPAWSNAGYVCNAARAALGDKTPNAQAHRPDTAR